MVSYIVQRILGIGLIILGIIIYMTRPLQTCSWWNIFCTVGSMALTPIYLIVSFIVIIIGVVQLVKGFT